jgi:hypothetical protein
MSKKLVWSVAAACMIAVAGCAPEPGASEGENDKNEAKLALLCDNVMFCDAMLARGYITQHQFDTATTIFPCLWYSPDGTPSCRYEMQYQGEWVRDFFGGKTYYPPGKCLSRATCQ